MKFHLSTRLLPILGILCCIVLFSCQKKFDQPEDSRNYDRQLPVNYTIRQLQLLPQATVITDDIIVSGIVVMDDKEGNYYKKIALQDTSGGIEVLIDQNNLYNDFPVGRKIYIKCKGLYIGAYGQNLQLGYTPDGTGSLSEIPYTLINDYVVKANYPNEIRTDTFSLSELANPNDARIHLNTLITIKDVEFAATGVTFAEPAGTQSATNRILQDCAGKQMALRTSGYSRFQSAIVPDGNGTITAIYSRYNNTPQLYIRNAADLSFINERCDGSTAPEEPVTLAEIRALVASFSDSIPSLASYKITGVVTSDKGSGNIVTSNIVLQDKTAGIVVRFSGTPSFVLGDSLLIDVTGAKLSWYANLLQISGVPTVKVSKIAGGKTVTPRVATIADIVTNYTAWESTLVKVMSATVAGGGTFSGNKTISDATASMTMYTRSAALFSGELVPTTAANYTGILGIYGTNKQLLLRSYADVEE